MIYENYNVPVLNIPSFPNLDTSCLKYGLNHCFINKHRSVKKELAIELEAAADRINYVVPVHELLRKMTCILSSNVLHAKDDTFNTSKALRNNRDHDIGEGQRLDSDHHEQKGLS